MSGTLPFTNGTSTRTLKTSQVLVISVRTLSGYWRSYLSRYPCAPHVNEIHEIVFDLFARDGFTSLSAVLDPYYII